MVKEKSSTSLVVHLDGGGVMEKNERPHGGDLSLLIW